MGSLGEFSIRDYVEIGLRRKWWIILSTLAFFVATVVFAHRLTDVYRAETVILVDSQEVPDKYVPVIVTADIAGRLSTLQQEVLSPTRLKKLVESEGLFPDPAGKLTEADVIRAVQKSIAVEVVNPGAGKMAAFRIAYSSRKRLDVARIANELAQMFIEENLKRRAAQTEGTAEFLEGQLQDTKRKLDEQDAQLQAVKAHNIEDLPESKAYHLEALATLRGRAQAIQDKIDRDQRDKSMLQSMLVNGSEVPARTVDVDGGGARDAVGPEAPAETPVQKLEQKLAQLRTRYGPAHPDVRAAQAELDRLNRSVAEQKSAVESRGANPAEAAQIQPAQNGHRNPVLEAEIEKLDEDIKQQSADLLPIQAQMDGHTSKLAAEPVFEQQIARLQQDYEILRTEYTQLLEKKAAAEMSHALEVQQQGERFIVLDAAGVPDHPAAPNRRMIDLAGLILGLLLGTALAALAETNDKSVRTESEAVRILGKPVLSRIPRIVGKAERTRQRLRMLVLTLGTTVTSAAFGFLVSIAFRRFL